MSTALRHALVDAARAQIGTKWQHQGRTPGVALDCVGLLIVAARATGVDTSGYERDIPNYSTLPTLRGLPKFFAAHLRQVRREDVSVGDVTLMTYQGFPMHCGIVTDWRHHGGEGAPFGLIHTWTAVRCVTEHEIADINRFSAHSFWCLPEID
ncbi:MAG: C40 family peptidase [Patescibacteria group bacterium]|nr:C40 family peptidase [Patescibacteria group bacterium]